MFETCFLTIFFRLAQSVFYTRFLKEVLNTEVIFIVAN